MAYESPWTYWAGDLATGKLYTEIPVLSDSWEHGINNAGPMSISMHMGDKDVQFVNPRAVLEPAKCFLAVSRGTRIFNAGPVWSHNWNPSTEILTINAANIWSYFDHRFIYPILNTPTIQNGAIGAPNPTGLPLTQADTILNNLSLRGVVAALIKQAGTHTGGSIPITTAAFDGEAGTESRAYYGYAVSKISDMLGSISSEDNGPDIRFDPQFNPYDSSSIQWVLNMGDPYIGNYDPTWIFEDGENLRELLGVTRDGTTIVNRSIATGAGSQQALVYAVDQNTQAIIDGYPLLEGLVTDSQQTDPAVLANMASGQVNNNQYVQETWKVRVSADDFPSAEQLNPGDTAAFRIYDDPYLGSVESDARIIAMSYAGPSAGEAIDLTLHTPVTTRGI